MIMHRELIHVPQNTRPILSVVVHTEEEFDWSRPFDRNATGVIHMRSIHRSQDLCDTCGIVPTYVVDYPIADQETGYRPLKEFADNGRALIGAHVHPWVSPPHTEEVCPRNSYPCNLPRDLEYEKLARLTERIVANFGTSPTVYLAGRYGFGPNTGEILEALDYDVDLSTFVPMDFTADGGPDYSSYTNHPFWFGNRRRLLGLCCNGAFVGWLPAGKRLAHRLINHPWLGWAHMGSILSRIRGLERIALTPEGFNRAELCRLTRSLLRQGCRIFVFSFHSPSVHPGFTPYVRNEQDLRAFLATCGDYFTFFLEELQGVAMTPLEIKGFLQQASSCAASARSGVSGP
jgi:hypothetical protein